MAGFVLKNAYVLVDAAPLASLSNELSLEINVETPDRSDFSERNRQYEAGLMDAAFSVAGYFDAQDQDAHAYTALGDTPYVALAADGEAGNIVYMGRALITNYSVGDAVGSVLPFSLSGVVTGALARGLILVNGRIGSGQAQSARFRIGAVTADHDLLALAYVSATTGVARGASIQRFAAATGGVAVDTHNFTPAGGAYNDAIQVDVANAAEYWQANVAAGEAGSIFIAAGLFNESLQVEEALLAPSVPFAPTPGRHARRAGISVDAVFTAAEFTAETNSDQITIPTFSQNRYLAFAVPDDQDDITGLLVVGSGLNRISMFERVAGTLDIGGVDFKVWRSSAVVAYSINSGTTWQIQQSS